MFFKLLLNIIEEQATTIKELREDNQQLKDGLNRLKGEQGKPSIKPNNYTGIDACMRCGQQ